MAISGRTIWFFLPRTNQLGLIDFEDVMIDAKYYDIALYLGAQNSLFKWDKRFRDDYIDYFIDRSKFYSIENINHNALRMRYFIFGIPELLICWEWLPNEYGWPHTYSFLPSGKDKEERCKNIYIRLRTLN